MDDMTNMIANGGWSTPEITSVGKPATNDLDGPAGINSLVSSLKGVSFPSEVIVVPAGTPTLPSALAPPLVPRPPQTMWWVCMPPA